MIAGAILGISENPIVIMDHPEYHHADTGMFMDMLIITISTPVLLPIATAIGMDPSISEWS